MNLRRRAIRRVHPTHLSGTVWAVCLPSPGYFFSSREIDSVTSISEERRVSILVMSSLAIKMSLKVVLYLVNELWKTIFP